MGPVSPEIHLLNLSRLRQQRKRHRSRRLTAERGKLIKQSGFLKVNLEAVRECASALGHPSRRATDGEVSVVIDVLRRQRFGKIAGCQQPSGENRVGHPTKELYEVRVMNVKVDSRSAAPF